MPVAAPMFGVVNTGLVDSTTEPEPVEVVVPVPPFNTGNAVPDKPTAKVPEVVIGLPVIDRNAGTVIPTDVTVPPVGVDGSHLPFAVTQDNAWPLLGVPTIETSDKSPKSPAGAGFTKMIP